MVSLPPKVMVWIKCIKATEKHSEYDQHYHVYKYKTNIKSMNQ